MVNTHQIKCNTSTYMRWGPTGPCERTIYILKILLSLFLLYVFNLHVKTSHMRSRSKAVLYPTLNIMNVAFDPRVSAVSGDAGTVRLQLLYRKHQIKCNTPTYTRWGQWVLMRTKHILKILLNLFLLYVFDLHVKTSHMRSRSNAVLYPTLNIMNVLASPASLCCVRSRGTESVRL